MSSVLLTLDCLEARPTALRDYLEKYHDLFLNWEIASATVDGHVYDDAIAGRRRVFDGYAMTGWHCTRLNLNDTFGCATDRRLVGTSPELPNCLRRAKRGQSIGSGTPRPALP